MNESQQAEYNEEAERLETKLAEGTSEWLPKAEWHVRRNDELGKAHDFSLFRVWVSIPEAISGHFSLPRGIAEKPAQSIGFVAASIVAEELNESIEQLEATYNLRGIGG